MKRVIFLVKEDQCTDPMTGTIAYNGYHIQDILCPDDFDTEDLEVLGMWQWDNISDELETLVELDEENFLNYLPYIVEYDEEGNVTSTSNPVFHIPHNWAGWPKLG